MFLTFLTLFYYDSVLGSKGVKEGENVFVVAHPFQD